MAYVTPVPRVASPPPAVDKEAHIPGLSYLADSPGLPESLWKEKRNSLNRLYFILSIYSFGVSVYFPVSSSPIFFPLVVFVFRFICFFSPNAGRGDKSSLAPLPEHNGRQREGEGKYGRNERGGRGREN